MYQLSNNQIKTISAGSQCEVITTIYSIAPNVFFEFNFSTIDDCTTLQKALESNTFHNLATQWVELGYDFNIELHELD